MRLHLFTTEYRDPLPETVFHALLTRLPAPLQQKVGKFRLWPDQHAALLGKLLLRRALEDAGYPADLDNLQYTESNKPFLPGAPSFNLSHSGQRVVCLLGETTPVGIDIESLTPLSFEDFEGQFTTKEWQLIRQAPDPLIAFYRFWTAKESLIKADGRGLEIPLRSLDLSETATCWLDGVRWSVHELPLFEGYACHYTVAGGDPPTIELHEVTDLTKL